MPLYRYRCASGHSVEKLHKYAERPVEMTCPTCGARSCLDVAASFRPAKTAGKWGESAGRYDRGLGCYVRNSAERDAVMAARGWVAESDMPNGYADSVIQTGLNEKAEHERNMAKYEYHLKEHKGDAGAAWAETFPAEEILSESDNADAS